MFDHGGIVAAGRETLPKAELDVGLWTLVFGKTRGHDLEVVPMDSKTKDLSPKTQDQILLHYEQHPLHGGVLRYAISGSNLQLVVPGSQAVEGKF